METPHHRRFSELFAQLGLPFDVDGIAQFLRAHRPLADNIKLADAPFWTPAQATFLKQAVADDSDWSGQADQLDEALRGPAGRSAGG